jgi:DNA invertase Pin-like site-specific DNA recombinase
VTVDQVHTDVDFSAYSGVVRPGYETLKRRIEEQVIDTVIFWKIDRLARNTREFLAFIDLCEKHDVAVVSVNEQFDTSSPLGRVIVTILAAFAELESATISLRIRSARKWEVENGKQAFGGKRRFGYTRDGAQAGLPRIVEDEAALLREAAHRVLTGSTTYSIAQEWNELGVKKTTADTKWSGGEIARMLCSPQIAGLRSWKGELHTGAWEPIIDRETYAALVARRKGNVSGRSNRGRRVNLLTGGVLYCGLCGSRMIGTWNNKRRAYSCKKQPGRPGCGKIAIWADPINDYVKALVLEALSRPSAQRALQPPTGDRTGRHTTILESIRATETRMAELGTAFAEGTLPLPAFQAASQRLQTELEDLNARLAREGERGILAGVVDIEAEWDSRDIEWQAKIVAAIFEKIEVLPAVKPGKWTPPEDRLRFTRRE